ADVGGGRGRRLGHHGGGRGGAEHGGVGLGGLGRGAPGSRDVDTADGVLGRTGHGGRRGRVVGLLRGAHPSLVPLPAAIGQGVPSGAIDLTSALAAPVRGPFGDRKSTRLNSSHVKISYA